MSAELKTWLIEQCDSRNLSWSEASRRAGVAPNTISEIINGTRPGVKRLTALAEYFGVSPEFLMRMSGHLPPLPDNGVDPRLQDTANRLIEVWEVLLKLDPAAAENLLRIAVMQAEMVKAAAQANAKRHESENTESTS